MRALGRLTCFVVVSSGTLTCLAQAQPSARKREPVPIRAFPTATTSAAPTPIASELVDPWSDETAPDRTASLDTRGEVTIIDPWMGTSRSQPMHVDQIELVDPWRDEPRNVPTASFPLIDPWMSEPKK
jgi:hypothetical protein